MSKKAIIKILIDIGMTISLMFLMAFELVGREAHEWIGMAMFVLFLVHHALNLTWTKNIRRGTYTPFRILQLLLVCLILISMMASMVSGIVLSRYIFSAVQVRGFRSIARVIHMLAAYWGYVLMSLHLGIHWRVMMGMAGRMAKRKSKARTWVLKSIGILIAGYGIFAFMKRDFGSYMLLQIDFVFYDFEEPLVLYLLDYLAIMGGFVWLGHYISHGMNKIRLNAKKKVG
ncbi:DUF4405 domain-containing protein [Luxibacter massiliensis]|uniref:DUF4405 domain-containing protein n=1 Tax=Luxibacter massiliensis TaxID=2219695 RepID=UPI000F05C307|nr:DUF4405 domain-containing protein [Luxibacter massiliensis]